MLAMPATWPSKTAIQNWSRILNGEAHMGTQDGSTWSTAVALEAKPLLGTCWVAFSCEQGIVLRHDTLSSLVESEISERCDNSPCISFSEHWNLPSLSSFPGNQNIIWVLEVPHVLLGTAVFESVRLLLLVWCWRVLKTHSF